MSASDGGSLVWSNRLPWERLRARVRLISGLYQPQDHPPAERCRVCRGPARMGYGLCYQCEQHEELGHGLLANTVVPISYAVRGTAFTSCLWSYKMAQTSDVTAGTALLALLLVFLRDHGDCVWRAARMPVPDRLVVVPSGYGREDVHPLLRLVAPHLRLPLTRLTLRPGEQGRDLNADRFAADASARGANVLLLDDTWVSGASVQSAAVALKLAGAAAVAAVVLGRYVYPGPEFSAHDLAKCAICGKRSQGN